MASSVQCDLTVDVYGGPKGQHLLLADIEAHVEIDPEVYAYTGVRVEDVFIEAPEWPPNSDPLTRPAEWEHVRPPEWLAHAIANIINSSQAHRRRIDDAIRDAGNLAAQDRANDRLSRWREAGL